MPHPEYTPSPHPDRVTEQYVLERFPQPIRTLFWSWLQWLVRMSPDATTQQALQDIDTDLKQKNLLLFFDHQFAFDVVPTAMGLARHLENIERVLAPYAAYLELGVNDKGTKQGYHQWRSKMFTWARDRLQADPEMVQLMPVVRHFEARNPSMRAAVAQAHAESNTRWSQAVHDFFLDGPEAGSVCFLAPMAGLAKPDRPSLRASLYTTLNQVQQVSGQSVPFYIAGAYPHRLLPGLKPQSLPPAHRHTAYALGPFELPRDNYDQALNVVSEALHQLRAQAQDDSALVVATR